MHLDHVAPLRAAQDGVVSRRQLLATGATSRDVERWVRRRELTRLHPGVYVDHTGAPTWRQRAWAATLVHAPAVLDAGSALRAWGVRTGAARDEDPLDVLVRHGRRVDDPAGVRTSASRAFDDMALQHLAPPRVRLEVAAVTVAAARRRPDATVAVLADAVQSRRTTPSRLVAAVEVMPRLRGRAFLLEVLSDVHEGAMSPLERRYLRDVERAHGLPRGERQARTTALGSLGARGISRYDDVHYPAYGVRVHLDGVLGHTDAADRWADLERDLDAAGAGEVSLRAGWRQVLAPCRLAATVGGVLTLRGWTGRAECPECERGGSSAAGAEDPPRSV